MKYFIANWKMNGNKDLIQAYQDNIKPCNHLIVCPPLPYLASLPGFTLGAQDVSAFIKGAYTGDVSASILKENEVEYVIIGHSERRQYHAESNELITQKIKMALNAGLTPIVCIGESFEQRSHIEDILKEQLEVIFETNQLIMIAYEPVWAIGTGRVPTPQDIEYAHSFIKSRFPQHPVMYGGSVTSTNVQNILSIKNVDGVLVGGASLNIEEVQKILSCMV